MIKVIRLKNWRLYFRKVYGRYNGLVQHYITPLSHCCDLVLCWCVLHTPDFTPVGYDWLYYWLHGGCVATAGKVCYFVMISTNCFVQRQWNVIHVCLQLRNPRAIRFSSLTLVWSRDNLDGLICAIPLVTVSQNWPIVARVGKCTYVNIRYKQQHVSSVHKVHLSKFYLPDEDNILNKIVR